MRPPWPYRLPSARRGRRRCAARRGRHPAAACRRRPRPGPRLAARVAAGRLRAAVDPAPTPRTIPRRPRGARAARRADALRARRRRRPRAISPRAFRGDPLLGAAIRHRPWLRPRRRPWPWEALAWAVTEQLIEVRRAVEIQRRIVGRWGGRLEPGERRRLARPRPLRDVPRAATIAGVAPGRTRRVRPRAGARDRADPVRARGRGRPRRSRPPGRRRPAARASARSGPGPSRCLGFAAAASPTRCPPATSPT